MLNKIQTLEPTFLLEKDLIMYLLIFLAICGKCETGYQYRYQHPQGLSLRRGRRQQRGHPLQPDRPRGPQ